MPVRRLRFHSGPHMPSGESALPWLGDYPYPGVTGQSGIHMIGTFANMPAPSMGSQTGSDGVLSGGGADFASATGTFVAGNTGGQITIHDPTTGNSYISTVTFVDTHDLTLSPAYGGTATSGLSWVLSGQGASNAGLTYYATDGTGTPTGSLYQSTGTHWIPLSGSGGAPGLPPWFEYTPQAQFDPGTIPVAEPTLTVTLAYIMEQTDNGQLAFPAGTGTPVTRGTVLGEMFVLIDDPGTPEAGAPGVYFVDISSAPDSFGALNASQVVGSGYILQASTNTYFTVMLLSDGGIGYMTCPNIPDLTGSGFFPSVSNQVRYNWPFVFAEGDTLFNGTWMYPFGGE